MKLEPSERWYDYRTDRASDAKIAAEATKRFADCKQNLYKDEIINSCAKIVEDAARRNGKVDVRASYYALMDVAKSIRALAK
jgi:hypothetical protein